jgi:nucleoside-diphosphate-sugar epimerase
MRILVTGGAGYIGGPTIIGTESRVKPRTASQEQTDKSRRSYEPLRS